MILVLGHTSCGAINGATQVLETGCFWEVVFHLYPTNPATKRGLKKIFYTSNGHLESTLRHRCATARLRLQAYLSKKDGDTSVGSALEGSLRDLMEVAETWKETSETHRLIDSHGLMVIFMVRLSKIMMLLETEFHEIL